MMSLWEYPNIFTFTFNIENFSMSHQKMGEHIESPPVLAEILDDTKWFLTVYPRSYEAEAEGYISIYLERAEEDDGPEEISIRFYLYLIANDGSLQEKHTSSDHQVERHMSWGFPKFISREALFNVKSMLLPNDTLKIMCQVERIWPAEPSKQDIFLSTRFGCEKVKFNWIVQDFSKCKETEQKLVKFASSRHPALEMMMREEEEGKMKIEIRLSDQTVIQPPVVVFCRMTVLDGARQPSSTFDKTDHYVLKNNGDVWYFPSFFTKDSLAQNHLPNDVLTLECEIKRSTGETISNVEKSVYDTTPQLTIADSIIALNNDFEKLLENKKNSDVELRISNKKVAAHKSLLFARSPVFREILKDKSPDANSGQIVVDIDDVDVCTLEKLLQFIYSEDTDPLDYESCLKLFAAADIYQVIALKEKCSKKLEELIAFENACEVLVAARLYSDPELENQAIVHLVENWDEISLSKEWEVFLEQNKELAAETRRRIRTLRLKE